MNKNLLDNNLFNQLINQNIDYVNLYLNLFWLSLIMIGIFLFFLFFTITLSKWLTSFKNVNLIQKISINLLIGLIFSVICPIIVIIDQNIADISTLTTQLVAIMAMGMFLSTVSLVSCFPIFLTTNLLMNEITNDSELAFVIIMYAFIVINVFVSRLFFNKKIIFILFTTFGLFVLTSIVCVIFYTDTILFAWLSYLLVSLLLYVVIYTIGIYISNFINKAYILKSSILYDNEYFSNSGFSKQRFIQYVKDKNVEVGIMVTFDLLYAEKMMVTEGKRAKNTLEKTFIKYIFQKMGNDCFYFKTKDNNYSLFYSIDKHSINLKQSYIYNKKITRLENDFLKKIESILNNFPKLINYNGKSYNLELVAFCSIYGIHSNSFDELINFNNTTKNNWVFYKDINPIKLYQYKVSSNFLDDKNKYIIANNKYDLEKINLSLINQSSYDLTISKSTKIYAPKINWFNKGIYSFDQLFYKFKDDKQFSTVLRNIAYRTLKLYSKAIKLNDYNKEKLLIIYPIEYIGSNEFNPLLFVNKILKLGIDLNSIIIYFSDYKKDDFTKKLIDNCKELKNQGINFCINKNYIIKKNDRLIYKQFINDFINV